MTSRNWKHRRRRWTARPTRRPSSGPGVTNRRENEHERDCQDCHEPPEVSRRRERCRGCRQRNRISLYRAGRGPDQDRRAASGDRRGLVFGHPVARGRGDGDRGHQRGRRHQVAGRRQIEAVLADAQSKADVGSPEVEKTQRGRASPPSSAAMPASSASRPPRRRPSTTFPISSMSASPTRSCQRGLTNTFRFSPGFGTASSRRWSALAQSIRQPGKPPRRR